MFNRFTAATPNPVIVGFMAVEKDLTASDVLGFVQQALGELVLNGYIEGLVEIRRATVEIHPIDDDANIAIIRAITHHDFTPIMDLLLKTVVDSKRVKMAISTTSTMARYPAKLIFTEYVEAPVESFKNAVYHALTSELKDDLHKAYAKPVITQDDSAKVSEKPTRFIFRPDLANVLYTRINLMQNCGVLSEEKAREFSREVMDITKNITEPAAAAKAMADLDDRLNQIELI